MEWEKREAWELHCYIIFPDLFTQRSTPGWVAELQIRETLEKGEEKGVSQAKLPQWAKADLRHLSQRLEKSMELDASLQAKKNPSKASNPFLV